MKISCIFASAAFLIAKIYIDVFTDLSCQKSIKKKKINIILFDRGINQEKMVFKF